MRRATVGSSVLIVLIVLLVTPARAGVGFSQWCSDDTPGSPVEEVHIIDDPITFNVEFHTTSPGAVICYSTTPYGNGTAAVTGGHIHIDGSSQGVFCREDTNIAISVQCAVVARTNRVEVTVRPRVGVVDTTTGVAVDGISAPACLDNLTFFTPAGPVGPFDVGLCPP